MKLIKFKYVSFSTSLLLLLMFNFVDIKAQSDSVKHWTVTGENSLLFNQTTFSNWSAGGINSFGGNLGLNYDFNYKKDRWNWDNKLIIGYGLSKQESIGWRKNDDRFIFNSLLGWKQTEKWLATFFLNFQTQFAKGYDYSQTNEPLISDLFAPATLSFGPGFAYKASDNFKINLSPAASRITFVLNDELSQIGAFGVEPGKNIEYALGASLDLYYKKEVLKNVTVENMLKLYSNYLDKPKNVDIDYTLSVFMKVNDYISASLGVQLVYDDDIRMPFEESGITKYKPQLQVKQLFGAGITYKF